MGRDPASEGGSRELDAVRSPSGVGWGVTDEDEHAAAGERRSPRRVVGRARRVVERAVDDEKKIFQDDVTLTSFLTSPEARLAYVQSFMMLIGSSVWAYVISELKKHFDFIIMDLSPSCSALNKMVAMSSDFVLSPGALDMYSAQAVHGLIEEVLPDWFKWQQDVVQFQEELP